MLNMFFIGILCWVSISDIYTRRIPDSAILAAIGFRIFFLMIQEGLVWRGLIMVILNGLIISLPLLFLVVICERLLNKYLLGGGDIKLVFVTGIYLGWEKNLWVLFIACLLGSVFVLLKQKRTETYIHFPFGPSIALAAIISMNFF